MSHLGGLVIDRAVQGHKDVTVQAARYAIEHSLGSVEPLSALVDVGRCKRAVEEVARSHDARART